MKFEDLDYLRRWNPQMSNQPMSDLVAQIIAEREPILAAQLAMQNPFIAAQLDAARERSLWEW